MERTHVRCYKVHGRFDLRERTRIGAMNRSGVLVERRILAGVGMAALCRDAATSRFQHAVARVVPAARRMRYPRMGVAGN